MKDHDNDAQDRDDLEGIEDQGQDLTGDELEDDQGDEQPEQDEGGEDQEGQDEGEGDPGDGNEPGNLKDDPFFFESEDSHYRYRDKAALAKSLAEKDATILQRSVENRRARIELERAKAENLQLQQQIAASKPDDDKPPVIDLTTGMPDIIEDPVGFQTETQRRISAHSLATAEWLRKTAEKPATVNQRAQQQQQVDPRQQKLAAIVSENPEMYYGGDDPAYLEALLELPEHPDHIKARNLVDLADYMNRNVSAERAHEIISKRSGMPAKKAAPDPKKKAAQAELDRQRRARSQVTARPLPTGAGQESKPVRTLDEAFENARRDFR